MLKKGTTFTVKKLSRSIKQNCASDFFGVPCMCPLYFKICFTQHNFHDPDFFLIYLTTKSQLKGGVLNVHPVYTYLYTFKTKQTRSKGDNLWRAKPSTALLHGWQALIFQIKLNWVTPHLKTYVIQSYQFDSLLRI